MSGLLGAIIAGGQARRFGADKALAQFRGRRLIDHVAAALRPQVDALILCGRDLPGWVGVPDRPMSGLGPLGGINAALAYAQANGFAAVLSVPCDAPLLPADLTARLKSAAGGAFVAELPVIGLWSAALAGPLDGYLRADESRSVQGAARGLGLTPVSLPVVNVNTPADLQALT